MNDTEMFAAQDAQAIDAFALLGVRLMDDAVVAHMTCSTCKWHAFDAEGNNLDGAQTLTTLLSWHNEGYFTAVTIARVKARVYLRKQVCEGCFETSVPVANGFDNSRFCSKCGSAEQVRAARKAARIAAREAIPPRWSGWAMVSN